MTQHTNNDAFAPLTIDIDIDNEMFIEEALDHSERAAAVAERLDALGVEITYLATEGWVYEGRVNVRRKAGTPYWQDRFSSRVVFLVSTDDVLDDDNYPAADIAIEVNVYRYGRNGKIRNGKIRVGAERWVDLLTASTWWADEATSRRLRMAGYSRAGDNNKLVQVVTEGKQAEACAAALTALGAKK